MSYGEFTFQKLETDLHLAIEEEDLYSSIAPIELRPAFAEILDETIPLALAINTEKARSELLIAPVLVELRKILGHEISLFSGIELNVDASKGLNGICDFLISASPMQILLTAPVISVVEAKNENIKGGIPQCAAEMYAAHLWNMEKKTASVTVGGAVTTGSSWKFLLLREAELVVDEHEIFIDNAGKILAILLAMVRTSAGPRGVGAN